LPIEEKYPDDVPELVSEDPPLACPNCVLHSFPCLNCADPAVDGPGHYKGVRYICEEEDQKTLDILFAWKQAHPYIPVRVLTCWAELDEEEDIDGELLEEYQESHQENEDDLFEDLD
jgi:hypothetical protein